MNPFVKKPEEYVRDIDLFKHYVNDASTFLSLSTGKSYTECKEFVTDALKKGGQYEFKDPKIKYLIREENGDRVNVESTLSTFLREAISEKEIIAPTLTTYIHPEKKKSLLAIFVDENIKARGKAKKEMFAAKANGDNILHAVKKIEQTGRKLSNNSISGAHVSPSNPLYNKTAHSTLTSGCRITSAYGNANNEKLLSGNRHYWNHHIVLNNIVSTINHTDYELLQNVIERYELVFPSVADMMECITYSSNLYWWEKNYLKKIEYLVLKLTPIQRAAFVYTGDLHHLKKLNSDFFRVFISKLSKKVKGTCDDPEGVLKKAPDGNLNLAHQICTSETMGIGKDHSKLVGTEKIHTLALTVLNIEQTVNDYSDLIRAIMVTTNLPASVSYFPESVRRSAVTSDTDSTIFTVQDWVMWYKNGLSFDEEAIAVMASLVYLASSSITHILATMSANLGIITEHIHRIEMKSEFSFHAFVATNQGKHYFASIGCQEGNVFEHRETEIKGVMLKSSSLPKAITKGATLMMEEIMDTVLQGKKLSMKYYLTKVADVERGIMDSIRKGEFEYLRTASIKDAESYTKDAEDSPYQNHFFWNDVFGPKYGMMPKPPYETAKVSVTTDTAQALKNWVDGMRDRDLAVRLSTYLLKKDKKIITTFQVPAQILQTRGFPPEILEIIDFRKIVGDMTAIYALILETIGFYTSQDKVKRLVSDFY